MSTWLKLYAEFATDPKVQSMTEAMQRRLIMLFCLECSGDLPKLEDHELCLAMRITQKELEDTRRLFVRKGFIERDWSPKNWDKRQQPTDPKAADRMRRVREERRLNAEQSRERSANVRPNNGERDGERSANVRPNDPERDGERSPPVAPHARSRELEAEEDKDFLPSTLLLHSQPPCADAHANGHAHARATRPGQAAQDRLEALRGKGAISK